MRLDRQKLELIKRVFPYPDFRPHQEEAIDFTYNVIVNRKVGLLSSPCGTGKSISVLTAYFMAREEVGGKLLALTRTRSQLEIYARELRAIRENSDINFVASIFRSKRDMCPLVKKRREIQSLSYRDFLHYCNNLKEGKSGEICEFFGQTYHKWMPTQRTQKVIWEVKRVGPLMPEEVFQLCEERGLCPYEVTKILAGGSDVIVGNYNYMLVDPVREALLRKTKTQLNKLNCVFDEAHSLPDYAVNLLSNELSTISITRAMKEAEEYGIDDGGVLEAAYGFIQSEGERTYRRLGLDSEGIIEKERLSEAFRESTGLSLGEIAELVSELYEEGELIRRRRIERGESPLSYVARSAEFFSTWMEASSPRYTFYAKALPGRGGSVYFRIGIKCLDPAMAAGVINELRSVILMSGTLGNPDYYVDILRIPRSRAVYIELPSPIPKENRLILVDTAVTTRFESRNEEMWRKIAERIDKLVGTVKGRTAVYFPSYEIMEKVISQMEPPCPLMVEDRNTKVTDLFDFLRKNEYSVFFGVARGKASEGVDMSMNGSTMLSMVIIVGLPYPKKTELQQALLEYYKERFGRKAHEYANEVPCLNAVTQAAGRLLRSPEDRGVIVLMDKRVTGRFKYRLPRDWRKGIEAYRDIDRIIERIESFFKTASLDRSNVAPHSI